MPANSCLLLDDQKTAREFPREAVRLALCNTCGFITNTAFDASRLSYGSNYEESQAFSPRFRTYIAELAASWVDRHSLRGKSVTEIGCGKGDFLIELLRAGIARGTGIDPSLDLERINAEFGARCSWIQGSFPDNYHILDSDAVVFRHTLEHIGQVSEWMRTIRTAIGRRETVVLVEVPDTSRILKEGAFWDIYYEHCSYFTAESLETLFRNTGFEPITVRHTFDDQYLVIEALPSDTAIRQVPTKSPAVRAEAAKFALMQQHLIQRWSSRVRDEARNGGRTVVWGASSKTVGFLSALGGDARHVYAAVDINPFKQGCYLAGSAHPIVGPSELSQIQPTLVVVTNGTYLDEIKADLVQRRVAASLELL